MRPLGTSISTAPTSRWGIHSASVEHSVPQGVCRSVNASRLIVSTEVILSTRGDEEVGQVTSPGIGDRATTGNLCEYNERTGVGSNYADISPQGAQLGEQKRTSGRAAHPSALTSCNPS